MQELEKAKREAISFGSNQKTFTFADGKQNAFDVFDFNQKNKKSQQLCDICRPSPGKRSGAANLCDGCAEKIEPLATSIYENIRRHRTVHVLRLCHACGGSFAASKFSRRFGICKNCVASVQKKSKIARSNFISRTLNNFHKALKEVTAL